jgi:orotidine-5'-phosphate decarboxylase
MNQHYISKKPIPTNERLIMALDFPSIEEAQALVEELGDSVVFYKVALTSPTNFVEPIISFTEFIYQVSMQ